MKPWIEIERHGSTGRKVYLGVADPEPEFVTIHLDSGCRVHWKSKCVDYNRFSSTYSMLLYAAAIIVSFWDTEQIKSDEDIEAVFHSCRSHFTADEVPMIFNAEGKCISHCLLTSDGKELDMPT